MQQQNLAVRFRLDRLPAHAYVQQNQQLAVQAASGTKGVDRWKQTPFICKEQSSSFTSELRCRNAGFCVDHGL